MKKTTFLIVGKHPVLEALKNPYRKIERVFLTEDAQKKLNRDNQSLNLFKSVNVFYKSRKELDNLCGGDETAHQGLVAEVEQLEEITLKEFVQTNSNHKLAGNAQYWFAETFRIRQLYVDAASAYLEGYQNYPKSEKAPINLLKLGTTLVQLGEKDQGCLMIKGVKKQYPKANKSVLQKAEYENKKFKCSKV